MKFLVCLLVTLGIAYAQKPDCRNTFCTMDLKICPDGTPAPVPADGCCPSLSACKDLTKKPDCRAVFCTMDLKICPDGTPAPVPADGCCPSLSACKPFRAPRCAFVMCAMVFQRCPDGTPARVAPGDCCPSLRGCNTQGAISRRSNPLASLGSLFSGNNLLQTLTSATHGTDLGTVLSILKLLNNIKQLSNDVHQIPQLINSTLANILNGTGQASQALINQLIGAVTHQNTATSRNLLGALGQNANLLSSIGKLLPQGTSISTVLSILNLLNNIKQLNKDVHQIPALLNSTLANIVGGAGQASQIVVDQLLSLIGGQSHGSRNLLGALGQNANLLSSIGKLLPQGTSISTVLSILNLLNNIKQLNKDIHEIPALLNSTLASIIGGAGQASQVVVDQLLNLLGAQSHGRNLLSALGQHTNLLSSVQHLLPQGTSMATVLSLLNLLSNVQALNNDLHQVPVFLQETLQNLLNGIQNLLPPTIQPL